MRNKKLVVAIVVILAALSAAVGVTKAFPEQVEGQTHWVNFGNGYANSHGTYGNGLVHIQSVSPYNSLDVRAVVDDNGGNHSVFIEWTAQCWNGSGSEIDVVSGSTTVDPNNYVINFNTETDHIRCELSVAARFTVQGVDGHLDVSTQAMTNH